VTRRRFAATVLTLAVVAAACGDDRGEEEPLPSGSPGVVTQEAAREAVLGLCELASTTDALDAEATFLDRSHATLHAIAAAAEAPDPASVTALLVAKQRVEAALARDDLPPRFRRDVVGLIDATRAALDALGLEGPACPS
jgi:hypothetical protein